MKAAAILEPGVLNRTFSILPSELRYGLDPINSISVAMLANEQDSEWPLRDHGNRVRDSTALWDEGIPMFSLRTEYRVSV